jgi:hypothetical protein
VIERSLHLRDQGGRLNKPVPSSLLCLSRLHDELATLSAPGAVIPSLLCLEVKTS